MPLRPLGVTARGRSALVIAVVVAGVAVGYLTLRPSGPSLGSGSSCEMGTNAGALVEEINHGKRIPTATDYLEAAHAIREGAVASEGDIASELHAIADAYGILSNHFAGFDPNDESTYSIVESRSAEIERQQTLVEQAAGRLTADLGRIC